LYLFLDFSNGHSLSGADKNAGPDLSLASRLLAVYVLRLAQGSAFSVCCFIRCFSPDAKSIRDLIEELRRCRGFRFADAVRYVGNRYRQLKGPDQFVTIVLHLDEYQFGYALENRNILDQGFIDSMVALPGQFLRTVSGQRTLAAEAGVILLPVLTGTTRGACKRTAPVSWFKVRRSPSCCELTRCVIRSSTCHCHRSQRSPSMRSSRPS
jgi:hypothetical protein